MLPDHSYHLSNISSILKLEQMEKNASSKWDGPPQGGDINIQLIGFFVTKLVEVEEPLWSTLISVEGENSCDSILGSLVL